MMFDFDSQSVQILKQMLCYADAGVKVVHAEAL